MIMYICVHVHIRICMYIHSISSAPLENLNTIAKDSEGPGALCLRLPLFSMLPSTK